MIWDYVIVGAGSAGCALAHEIVNGRPDSKVLVLEAGGTDRSPLIRFPAGSILAIAAHDWGYRCQPDPSCGGATEPWFKGRVLGGSSSINSTVFVRGADADFDRWSNLAGSSGGWSAADVAPLFRELETSDQNGLRRGRAGSLWVRTVRRPHTITRAFVESAIAWGLPFNEDYNNGSQEGISYVQLSQRRGLRCSSADAFLKPLLGKAKNLELQLNACVHRLEIESGVVKSVSYFRAGRIHRAIGREVVLCAGAINSPKILMLSGIGEPEELKSHGIDVMTSLRGVGRNLREHPMVKLVYRSRIPTYNLTGGLRQKLGFAAQFLFTREGPISNTFESVGFFRSSPSEPSPDVQLHFEPVGLLNSPGGAPGLAPYPSVTMLINKSHPLSTGRVRLASADPAVPPRIECQLLVESADLETLVRGVKIAREIMQKDPIASLVEGETTPGSGVKSDTGLRDYVKSHTRITFHAAGTCRMGTSADADAVVGADLRVHGLQNLWVADASIMPDLISGNTNAACMMIGRKLGRELVARSRTGQVMERPDSRLKRHASY